MTEERQALFSMKQEEFLTLTRTYPSTSQKWGYVHYKDSDYFFQLDEKNRVVTVSEPVNMADHLSSIS